MSSSDGKDSFKIVQAVVVRCYESEGVVDDDSSIIVFVDSKMESNDCFVVPVVFHVVDHDGVYRWGVD